MTDDIGLCHPDEITNLIPKSSGQPMQDVIRMTYDVARCHPDDITYFTT